MIRHRAFAVVEVKSFDDDLRTIEGMASTPSTDRVGDIVEPSGAKFTTPLPLLWQHQSDKPIGWVTAAKVSASGVSFTAQLAKIAEPGPLKDVVDTAWTAIKSKLVRGVSIGFRALDYEVMPSGGLKFLSWEWLELSAVTIPANADATIDVVRSAFASSTQSAWPRQSAVAALSKKPADIDASIAAAERRLDLALTRQATARDCHPIEATAIRDAVAECEKRLGELKALKVREAFGLPSPPPPAPPASPRPPAPTPRPRHLDPNAMAEIIGRAIRKTADPIRQRVEVLESRLAKLEGSSDGSD